MNQSARTVACRCLSAFVGQGLVLGLAALVLAVPRASAAEDEQQKGIALIARAQLLEKLVAPDSGPFRLRAHVKLFGLVEGTREGEYLLLAASAAQWFDQTRFPGYSELTGMSDGQRWRKRNVIDKPFRFHEVAQRTTWSCPPMHGSSSSRRRRSGGPGRSASRPRPPQSFGRRRGRAKLR
jgi:hypothetical protein